MLWDLAEGKRLYSLDAGDVIHALCFSPNRYWLCAATQACIKVPPSILTCPLAPVSVSKHTSGESFALIKCPVHLDKVLT